MKTNALRARIGKINFRWIRNDKPENYIKNRSILFYFLPGFKRYKTQKLRYEYFIIFFTPFYGGCLVTDWNIPADFFILVSVKLPLKNNFEQRKLYFFFQKSCVRWHNIGI